MHEAVQARHATLRVSEKIADKMLDILENRRKRQEMSMNSEWGLSHGVGPEPVTASNIGYTDDVKQVTEGNTLDLYREPTSAEINATFDSIAANNPEMADKARTIIAEHVESRPDIHADPDELGLAA